jgi:hypothetical protein
MTTAEQPAPEGDKPPPQSASVNEPDDGSDASAGDHEET